MRPDKTCHNLNRKLCKDWKRCTFHRVFDLRTKSKTHYMRPDLKRFRYDRDEDSQQLRWATHCGIDIGYRVSWQTIAEHIPYTQHKAKIVFETLTAWQRPPIFPSEDPAYEVFIRCGTSWSEILVTTGKPPTCSVCAKSKQPIGYPNKTEDPWIYRAPEDPEAYFEEMCKRNG